VPSSSKFAQAWYCWAEQVNTQARRPCGRCSKPLTKARIAKGKRYCYLCEKKNKRDSRVKSHDRRVCDVYGLNPGDYDLLLAAQNGKCPVKNCRANGTTKFLAVEHDHKLPPGRLSVRGLMCSMHNGWIGKAGDDPEVFESIAAYLRNPPAREVLK